MKKILFTGATGFVGKRYSEYSKDKFDLYPFSIANNMPTLTDFVGIDTVLHLGGLAHQTKKTAPEKYFEANFSRTKELADLAKKNGVRHFIFISSIKVFGEKQNMVLTEKSTCTPENDPYGKSKLMAELYLRSIEDEHFKVAIIRPPLIYGPGVKGNLARLLELCDSCYPLPFGSIHNRRTMVYVDNFIELINRVVDKEVSGLFLSADNSSVTTSELILCIRSKMRKSANLFALPNFLRKIIALVRPAVALRLFGSLEMDTSSTNRNLGFIPPYPIEKGIDEMVNFYMNQKTSVKND